MILILLSLSCKSPAGRTATGLPSARDDSHSGSADDTGEPVGDSGEPVDDTSEPPDDTAADDTGGGETGAACDTGGTYTTVPVDHELETLATMKLVGPEPYATWGWSIATTIVAMDAAGDINGDGEPDFVLGLPGAGDDGQVYVVTDAGPPGVIDLSEAEIILTTSDEDDAGGAVAGAGDVDGDGYDDLLIGAHSYNIYDGRAYVVSGPLTGGLDLGADALAILEGEQGAGIWSPSETGATVAAGDTNGDGYSDLAIGAPWYVPDSKVSTVGRVYLVNGPTSGAQDLATAADATIDRYYLTYFYYSTSLDMADVDGDGLDDVLIGSMMFVIPPASSGALAFLGPVSGSLLDLDADIVLTNSSSTALGMGVARALGDVDGDGYTDISTSLWDSSLGSVHVVLGPLTRDTDLSRSDAELVAELESDSFGGAVDGAGDIDGDGLDDIIVGAQGPGSWGAGWSEGAVYLVHGPVCGVIPMDRADYRLFGTDQDRAGATVAGVGDIDSDGLDDVLVGGPGDTDGGEEAGAAWLVLGSTL